MAGPKTFYIYVCVFEAKTSQSLADWLGGVDGYPSDKDIASSSPINGNTAYYVKAVVEEHGYDEITYVISAKNKLVYIKARTYEKATNDPTSNGQTGDFRQYEPHIKDLAYSVKAQ